MFADRLCILEYARRLTLYPIGTLPFSANTRTLVPRSEVEFAVGLTEPLILSIWTTTVTATPHDSPYCTNAHVMDLTRGFTAGERHELANSPLIVFLRRRGARRRHR